MKTRAAVLHQVDRPFEIEELDLADPRDGEVLVRVEAAGVCHSDWHLVTGATQHPLPAAAGHEGAGTVEAVGNRVDRVACGDRVILNWAPSCRECFYCRIGRPNLCSAYLDPIWAGCMLDGTPRLSLRGRPVYHYCGLACFSERVVVPQECCVRLEHDLPAGTAALIGCAVTTGVGSVLNTAKVAEGSSVVVFGVGGVGLSVMMGARLARAESILAVDPLPSRREMAGSFGATLCIDAGVDVVPVVREATGGRGADYAFDTSGDPAAQEMCLEAARPGGTVVLVGLAPMGSTTNLPGAVIARTEKTVVGSYYGTADPDRDFPKYADLCVQGTLPLERLVSRRYRLEQVNQAFDDMLNGWTARGVILFR